jgi:hypothetical protein
MFLIESSTRIICKNYLKEIIKSINIATSMKNNNEPKFMGKAKLTKQGQVTLPREARRALNIEEESEIFWYQVKNTLIAVKDLVATKDLKIK